MKNHLIVLIVLSLAILASPSWAQSDMPMAKAMTAESIRQANFSKLLSVHPVTLNTTASVNFVGSTATGSTAISLPTVRPFLMRLQNHNVGSITYNLFAANATGVIQPTATNSHLLDPSGAAVVSGKAHQRIYHDVPGISIGASGSTAVIIEFWGQE